MSSSPADRSGAPRLVLGTAGHIDHGKTSLVRALTGTDTDRLPEEKARGITIDLGFASLELPDGTQCSVVDVPGHERLVRTMIAGATGIDLLLLVVAADEGVMPQTREHLAICELLGLERGVVALTKSDLVDDEMRELAAADVEEALAGTALAGSAIVPVSSTTGDGLGALRAGIAKLSAESAPRTPRSGPARLGVDRVFAMKGFGTVVTGTLVGAALEVGQEVELLPNTRRARVRGLQSHGRAAERVEPGVRCAVNLQGLDVADIKRGDLLCTPASLVLTRTLDAELRWLPWAPVLGDSLAIELLAGTAERRAHLAPIAADEFRAGESGFVRIHIDGEPLALLPGDRVVARGFAKSETYGSTLGGGQILDVAPPRRRRNDPALARELELFREASPLDAVRERVARGGLAGARRDALQRELGLSRTQLEAAVHELEKRGQLSSTGAEDLVSSAVLDRLATMLSEAVARFHDSDPLRPGMPRAAALGALPENVPSAAAETALEQLVASGTVLPEGKLLRSAGHAPRLDDELAVASERLLNEARAAGLEAPAPRDWCQALGLSLDRLRDLLAHLEREGLLIRAPGDLWFAREAVDGLEQRVVAHLEQHGRIDTAAYKDLTGTSRRTTVPLMELLDELHVTRRDGDARVLRKG